MRMHALLKFIVISLLCTAVSCFPPRTPAPRAKTSAKLKNIYAAMGVLEAENHLSIAEQLRRVSQGTTVPEKWMFLLGENANKLGMEPKQVREELYRDGYGNLFNVDFKTNIALTNASRALLETRFDVVVWSSGRNQINEYGRGDDVFLTMSPERK